MKTLVRVLATWFGLGLLPFSPGTFGTLGAIPLVFLLVKLGSIPYMLITVVGFGTAVFIAQMNEIFSGHHDSPQVVIDEVVGFLVTMTWIDLNWKTLLLGFVLFRLFDIVKPFPIGWLDRNVKGGVGVVADDVAAGMVANILMQVACVYGSNWLR